VPLLKGEAIPERTLYWHYPHYGNQGGAPVGAVRRGDWKLIEWYEDNTRELYNLRNDIAERENLAAKHVDIVRELAHALETWRRTTGARMPSENQKFDPKIRSGRSAERLKSTAKKNP